MDNSVELDPSSFLGRLIFRYYGTYSLDEAAKQEREDRQEANDPDWFPTGKQTRSTSHIAISEPRPKLTLHVPKTKHAPLWSSLVQVIQSRCIMEEDVGNSTDAYLSIVTHKQIAILDMQVATVLVIGERLKLRFPDLQPSIDHLLNSFICYITSLWTLRGKALSRDASSASLLAIYNTVTQFVQRPSMVHERVASMGAVTLCPPIPISAADPKDYTPPILPGECSLYSFAQEYGLDPKRVIRRSPSQVSQVCNRCQHRVNTITE
ncbi:Hypothetical protein GSB_150102 [Giardia duodenalis]|uniref:Uncharacterized protein n=2 Tax=Giardia intestinalis TaxID=5741 RepID=C6LNU0_GIAIB|nr:Hypothetical protein GL50581_397 [Giardia intestinalis ATCC 50581]ESU45400.1 Hypothetical protein GSB_150102 [Giardia intestinalis]